CAIATMRRPVGPVGICPCAQPFAGAIFTVGSGVDTGSGSIGVGPTPSLGPRRDVSLHAPSASVIAPAMISPATRFAFIADLLRCILQLPPRVSPSAASGFSPHDLQHDAGDV